MQSCQGLPRLLALTSLTGALSFCYQHDSFRMIKSTPRKPSTKLCVSLLRLHQPFLATAVDSVVTLCLKSGNMAGEENGLHQSFWKFSCPAIIKRQIREGGHLGTTRQSHPMTIRGWAPSAEVKRTTNQGLSFIPKNRSPEETCQLTQRPWRISFCSTPQVLLISSFSPLLLYRKINSDTVMSVKWSLTGRRGRGNQIHYRKVRVCLSLASWLR